MYQSMYKFIPIHDRHRPTAEPYHCQDVELPTCIAQDDTLPEVLDRIKNAESYADAKELNPNG